MYQRNMNGAITNLHAKEKMQGTVGQMGIYFFFAICLILRMIPVCTFPLGGKYQRPPGAGEFPCLPHRPRTPVFLSMSSCGSLAGACEGVHDRAAHMMVRLAHRESSFPYLLPLSGCKISRSLTRAAIMPGLLPLVRYSSKPQHPSRQAHSAATSAAQGHEGVRGKNRSYFSPGGFGHFRRAKVGFDDAGQRLCARGSMTLRRAKAALNYNRILY